MLDMFAKCCCSGGVTCSHCIRLTAVVLAIIFGSLIAWKPRKAIDLQIALYRPFNWKLEPISMKKEVRNTRIMGLAVVVVGIFSFILLLR